MTLRAPAIGSPFRSSRRRPWRVPAYRVISRRFPLSDRALIVSTGPRRPSLPGSTPARGRAHLDRTEMIPAPAKPRSATQTEESRRGGARDKSLPSRQTRRERPRVDALKGLPFVCAIAWRRVGTSPARALSQARAVEPPRERKQGARSRRRNRPDRNSPVMTSLLPSRRSIRGRLRVLGFGRSGFRTSRSDRPARDSRMAPTAACVGGVLLLGGGKRPEPPVTGSDRPVYQPEVDCPRSCGRPKQLRVSRRGRHDSG